MQSSPITVHRQIEQLAGQNEPARRQKSEITPVPNFGLYGSAPQPGWHDLIHFEQIPERARLYGWEIDPHSHDDLIQVIYPTAGGGEIMINQQRWPIEPPCIVLVPPGAVHSFRFTHESNGPVITFAQRPVEAVASLVASDLLPMLREPLVIAVDSGSRHLSALHATLAEVERETRTLTPGRMGAGIVLLVALLVQIGRLRNSLRNRYGRGAADLGQHDEAQIERFRALLDAHWRQRWRVEDYAQAMNVAPGHLRRICRKALGHSAIKAINARVLHEAQRELAYSGLSVKVVASTLGFEDEDYFGRFFKKHTGVRPTEFRHETRRQLASTQVAYVGHSGSVREL